jgi:hypothetical protein
LALACGHARSKGAAAPDTPSEAAKPEGEAVVVSAGVVPISPPGSQERDPNAITALRRMGEFLRKQGSFIVHSETSTDEVLATGQKIQLDGTVELKVVRPNRLRAEIHSDRKRRSIFYDGTSFTVFGEQAGYYAQAPAPGTIEETVAAVQDRFAISMPLVDLFYWSREDADVASIVGAIDIGPSLVKGIETEHYAFRQSDVAFQVWIEAGDRPLLRKFVITTLSEPEQPQHSVLLTWSLNPKLDDGEFKFAPPPGAQRIVFQETQP